MKIINKKLIKFFNFNFHVHKILQKIFKESGMSMFVHEKKFIIISLMLLTNCSAPGTALLGPIFTGAKTGSVYQASLSYGSNRIIDEFRTKENLKTFNNQSFNKNKILPDIPYIDKDPIIILSYKVNKIEISDVFEPEPLP